MFAILNDNTIIKKVKKYSLGVCLHSLQISYERVVVTYACKITIFILTLK